ncbi:hypothetical protein R3Q06_08460 [Rhodococcus erythropolis]|uniref:hypothetical protein n=1 Tax=Rhodococcus erythropolis TaxID=1833 RepID=UPI002949E7C3|nr:hypothetical protein [Rhodococcus erythropolis]MDV6273528.1 hypothetical protein [Rhodococcus erythropolis]
MTATPGSVIRPTWVAAVVATMFLVGGGQVWNYRIDAVDRYGKDGDLTVERLNSLGGAETIALITCGDEFVGPPFGYEDNDVAWGTPVAV